MPRVLAPAAKAYTGCRRRCTGHCHTQLAVCLFDWSRTRGQLLRALGTNECPRRLVLQ